jgi:hypothetical protein
MDLPGDDVLCGIVRAYARMRADHGEAIGAPLLVEPTGEFFPDRFDGDAASVARLLRRMIALAPIADDVEVSIAFVAPDEARGAGGCGSLACGSAPAGSAFARHVEELGDGYRIFVSAADVGQPVLLTTSLARSVGAIVLREAGEDPDEADEAASEIAATVCGFGVLVLNGAALWGKSCGGLRMAQATALTVEEAAVTVALFLGVHGLKAAQVRRHLDTSQQEALDLAVAWAESNPLLVETLRDHPSLLKKGTLEIEPLRGIVGRWLNKRRIERAMRLPATSTSRAKSPS